MNVGNLFSICRDKIHKCREEFHFSINVIMGFSNSNIISFLLCLIISNKYKDNQLIIFHHQSSTMATAADDFGEVYTGGQGGQGGPGGQGEEQDFFAAQGNNNAEAPAAGAPGN